MSKTLVFFSFLFAYSFAFSGVATWSVNANGESGPVAQTFLLSNGSVRRASFVAFEYARGCDPMFSFAEVDGASFGKQIGQHLLKNTKIGVYVNGRFYTWHAATTKYSNGSEYSFGVTNDLFDALSGKINSLSYVTPHGERIELPVSNFSKTINEALIICAKKIGAR